MLTASFRPGTSAWKKLKKQKAREEKAKAKAAARAAKEAANPSKKKKSSEEDEEKDLTPDKYFEIRAQKIRKFEKAGYNPFPHKFDAKMSIPNFVAKFKPFKDGETSSEATAIAGRVTRKASQGKLKFLDISADGARVQIFCNPRAAKDAKAFGAALDMIRRGDLIGVNGTPGRTKTGELSIFATDLTLLAPCLRMLPPARVGP